MILLFPLATNLYICPKLRCMQKKVTPYKDSNESKKKQVTNMFDTISGSYDDLNRVISLGLDVKWRKKVVALVSEIEPKKVLDVATGTGDLAINLVETNADEIIGLDISNGMLEVGRKKIYEKSLDSKIKMVLGDGEHIDYPDNYFDAITVSFGVRNFENLEQGLSEIFRVLKPNGVFAVLETSVPTKFPFKQGYHLYTNIMVPAVGKLFSKDKGAYSYLSKSAAVFPYGEEFNNILRKIGFINVVDRPQTFGVSTIYTSSK